MKLDYGTMRARAINAGSHFFERSTTRFFKDVRKWATYDKETDTNYIKVRKANGEVLAYKFYPETDDLVLAFRSCE